MSRELINPYQQFRDSNGNVLAAGTLTFNVNLTSTLDTIYSDEALTVAQSNPYTLDASGRVVGDIRYSGVKRMVVKDSTGATIRTLDNVATLGSEGSAGERPYTEATVATMKVTARYLAGDVVRTIEHTAGYGYGGGNLYLARAVTGGSDDNATLIKSTGNTAIEFIALFPEGVNDKHFGTAHDNATDDSVGVMAGYAYTAANSVEYTILDGDIYITDQGGSGIALDWDGGHSGLRIDMRGTFQYKGGTGIALRIGQGPNPIVYSRFRGLRVNATIQTPYENLVGVGVRLVEVNACVFKDCFVSGFLEGYSLRPNAETSAVASNTFYDCSSIDCYYNIYAEPGDFDTCYVTDNKWFGGFHTTPPGGFSDIVTANAHLISLHNPYRLTRSANTVDGNRFYGVKIEELVTRRIYCEGNSNYFIGIYLDTGTLASGGTHAAGVYPYRQTGITGFTSDGSGTITKVGHGLTPYVRKGDMINIGSAADINDSRDYVVVAVAADTIQLNKAVVGVGAITIAHFSANIEFSETGNRNVIDSETAGVQVITSVSITQDNQIRCPTMGLVQGPLPPLGTKGDDTVPGGITDTPQPGLFNLWAPTIAGAGTINCYLGNLNDDDTNANVQLCFGALDSSDRPGVFASIMANKEGRNTSQPHGGLILRTRASGSNSYLVDRLAIDSNGDTTIYKTLKVAGLNNLQDSVTADPSGTQAGATQLNARKVFVTTSAGAGDSCKMPNIATEVVGAELVIKASAAFALFPSSGDQFEGSAVDASIAVGAGTTRRFVAVSTTVWKELDT